MTRIGLAILFFASIAAAEIIPAGRRVEWTPGAYVGVPGGIPVRTAVYTNVVAMGADTNGTYDCRAIFQSALDNCPSNKIIYVPAGRYVISNGLSLVNPGVTFRGAGMGRTIIIDQSTNTGPSFTVGNSPSWTDIYDLASGYTKDSTNLVLQPGSHSLTVGMMVRIMQSTNDSNFVASTLNFQYLLSQMAVVTAVVNSNITIWPPMVWTYTNTLKPQIFGYSPLAPRLSGFEDFTITHSNSVNGAVGQASQSFYGGSMYGWWWKRVESSFVKNIHAFLFDAMFLEIRECYFHEASAYGPNAGVGIEFYSTIGGSLIENNIIRRAFPSILISTCSARNVVGYNFSYDVQTGTSLIGGDINCNHGPHAMMNLYEGNIGHTFQSDGFYGSASHVTVFRNHFGIGHPSLTQNNKALDLDRMSTSFNVVGNVLGDTNVTASSYVYEQTTNSYSYDIPVIYRLGFPNMGNNAYTGTNTVAGYPFGYDVDQWDVTVTNALIRHGNWDYKTGATNWDSTIVDQTLPTSYYLTNRPSWFSNDVDYPYNPFEANAAQLRFIVNPQGGRVPVTWETDGTVLDISNKISMAWDGDTVTIPAGTLNNFANGESVVINKRIHVQGAGTNLTTINLHASADYPFHIAADSAELSGFTINGNDRTILNIQNYNWWKIHDISFLDPVSGNSDVVYLFYIENGYGLFYRCNFRMPKEQGFIRGYTNAWATPDSFGTTNAVYFEDCIMSTDSGYIDANSHAKVVWRYNTINGAFKFDAHGINSNEYPPGTGRSARLVEAYFNNWTGAGFFNCLEMRGGTFMIWSNTSPTSAGNYILLQDYDLSQGVTNASGYPIRDQVGVGMDPKVAASSPGYLWGNNKEGVIWQWTTNYPMTGVIENNRDVYEQTNGTFNGSWGVGIGTTSTMNGLSPTHAGVGFWSTTDNTLYVWNGSSWTNKYTPLTYPHPLRSVSISESEPVVVSYRPSLRTVNAKVGRIRKP